MNQDPNRPAHPTKEALILVIVVVLVIVLMSVASVL